MSTENDKEELTEELEHQRQMVKALRRRRRLLEHTHVIKGRLFRNCREHHYI
jgi:hypothetical protein